MRKKLSIIISVLFLFGFVSCAGWDTTAKKAYVSTGKMGNSYYETAKSSCDHNLIQPATCEQLKKINNDARAIWLKAGDVLVLAINTGDAVKRQQLLAEYNVLMGQFESSIGGFIQLYLQMGGKL
jgi:hypothetical protein